MSTTKSEEYNEIASNILLNLFYDEQNLDMIITNVRNYKRQSFGYESLILKSEMKLSGRLHLTRSHCPEVVGTIFSGSSVVCQIKTSTSKKQQWP